MDISARQVLLCAGAIHSPAILLRSGLGPAAELMALSIPVVRDLPELGRNFMDHPTLRAAIALLPEQVSRDPHQRHTNCCVTYTSGLGGGGRRDMIMIGFKVAVADLFPSTARRKPNGAQLIADCAMPLSH